MENQEKIRHPELKLEELFLLIDSIKWEQGFRFKFNGTEFYINITESERLGEAKTEEEKRMFGKSAEYFASTY